MSLSPTLFSIHHYLSDFSDAPVASGNGWVAFCIMHFIVKSNCSGKPITRMACRNSEKEIFLLHYISTIHSMYEGGR